MSKSLADLRADKPTARPERSLTVCLRPDLVARVQALTSELANLPEPERPKVRKMAEASTPEHPRAGEIRDELDALLVEVGEHEGEIVVRANLDDGEWRRWADAHPARPEGQAGHDRDNTVTGGFANADDLIDTLAAYVTTWNGEPLGEGDWAAIFAPVVPLGDKQEMARLIVAMYEGRMDFPQWRSALSAALLRSVASALPATSASPSSDSTGGNPDESSEAMT